MYNNKIHIYIYIMDMPCRRRHRTTKRRLDSYTHTHTHTHTVYYALTYIIIWRAEPVRLVRDRVEDRSSATTDCVRSDGGGGIIIWRRAYTCRFDFRISSSPPTAANETLLRARRRRRRLISVARDRPTDHRRRRRPSSWSVRRARALRVSSFIVTHTRARARITWCDRRRFFFFTLFIFLMVV